MGDEKMHNLPPLPSRSPTLPDLGFAPLPPIPAPLPPPSYEELAGIADDGTPLSMSDEAPNTPPLYGARPPPTPRFEAADPMQPEASFPTEPPPSSRRKFAIAPNLPQIPKPIVHPRPIEHAPGIVSTQAFPLTEPPRKFRPTPIFVTFMFMLVGGVVAALVVLFTRSKQPEASGGAASPAQTATFASAESPAPVASTSQSPSASADAKPEVSTSVSASSSAVSGRAPVGPLVLRPSVSKSSGASPAAAKIKPKSDRIED